VREALLFRSSLLIHVLPRQICRAVVLKTPRPCQLGDLPRDSCRTIPWRPACAKCAQTSTAHPSPPPSYRPRRTCLRAITGPCRAIAARPAGQAPCRQPWSASSASSASALARSVLPAAQLVCDKWKCAFLWGGSIPAAMQEAGACAPAVLVYALCADPLSR